MNPFLKILFLTLTFSFAGCISKPTVPPAPFELKQLFYSLVQSNFSGYRCDVQSQLLLAVTDAEMDSFFRERFNREATLQEKGMLKKVKWGVVNSNEKQTVIPVPSLKFFPSTETRDVVEKITTLLTIMNKVMTLTYLETFADRPDLTKVQIGDKFFKVLNASEEVVAELDFNRQVYRIFFGAELAGVTQAKDQIEVTMAKLGSMEIPEMIEIKAAGKVGKFYPHFEVVQGFPQIKRMDVSLPELGQTKSPFVFEGCEYLKTAEPTN